MRWFASGMVVAVSPELDLIDVAVAMTNDDAPAVADWMRAQRLAKVSDEQAQRWLDQDCQVWAIVVKPWILVQLRSGQSPP